MLSLGFGGAHAADKPVLTITYDSFTSEWGPGPAIETAFEAQCNCDLNFVALDSSIGILGRVSLKVCRQRLILCQLDTNLTDIARKTGLFQPHGSLETADNLPTSFTDDIFMPSIGVICICL